MAIFFTGYVKKIRAAAFLVVNIYFDFLNVLKILIMKP